MQSTTSKEELDIIPFLNKHVRIIILVCVILLAIYGGKIYGYNQGYTYVQKYYERKIEDCFCPEEIKERIIGIDILNISTTK